MLNYHIAGYMRKNTNTIIIISLLLVGLVVIGLLRLGFWQLERAADKKAYFEQVLIRTALPHQRLSTLILGDVKTQDLNQYPVKVAGTLLHQFTFLLDNVTHNGRVGYHVIVPLLSDDYSPQIVLVNLGWVANNGYRELLPELEQWPGIIEVRGSLHQPVDNPYAFEAGNTTTWPRVIGQLDIDNIQQQLETTQGRARLLPAVLRVDESLELGYQKKWLWVNMSVEKHIGYAVQWFALALTLCILTFWFYWRVRTKEKL